MDSIAAHGDGPPGRPSKTLGIVVIVEGVTARTGCAPRDPVQVLINLEWNFSTHADSIDA